MFLPTVHDAFEHCLGYGMEVTAGQACASSTFRVIPKLSLHKINHLKF